MQISFSFNFDLQIYYIFLFYLNSKYQVHDLDFFSHKNTYKKSKKQFVYFL